jgi:mRNA (guanine-N7-)-methyltransferase
MFEWHIPTFHSINRTYFLFESRCAGSFVKDKLLDKLDSVAPGIFFDAVSCQFAIHYSWTSEVNARNALKNAAGRLKKGGLFIGITTDANVLVKNLQAADGLKFGNR